MDRNKRRITHLGQPISRRNKNLLNDVVADIMNKMDASIADSEFLKILNSRTSEGGSCQNNQDMPPVISAHRSTASVPHKKFLGAKHHPLMLKAQKSINYIKHNRSIPKPRAHLGGFGDSVQKKKDKVSVARRSSSSYFEKTKQSSCVSAKNLCNESNSYTDFTISNDDISGIRSRLSDLSSDSETDFESFIKAQKHDTDCVVLNPSRDKNNRKPEKRSTKGKGLKQKNYIKTKKLKSIETETEDNKSLSDSKISSKVTATNRQKLPETSDSSVSSHDENESISLLDTEKAYFTPSETENSKIESRKQIDKHNFKCFVRLERNPLLEKTATELSSPLKDNENRFSCQIKGSKNADSTEIIESVVDFDDDCLIVCEVPESDNHTSICDTGEEGSGSEIQILNVVSLGEKKDVINTNEGNIFSTQSSSGDNSGAINFERLKDIIENTEGSHFSALQEETSSPVLNNTSKKFARNITAVRMETNSDCNISEKSYPSISTDCSNIFNKIDLKQILSLACNKSSTDVKVTDSLSCTSSTNLSLDSCLPSKMPKIITDDHWINLKKAVGINNCTNEPRVIPEHLEGESINVSLVKSENTNRNRMENEMTPSSEFSTVVSGCDLSGSALKEIICNAEQLTRANDENTFSGTNTVRFQLKRDSCEDPSNELDVLGTTSFRELWSDQSSPAISNMLHEYSKTLQEYNEIKNSKNTLTYSLKLLQDSLESKKRHMEAVLGHLIKSDPCFYSTAKSNQEMGIYNSKTSLIHNAKSEDISFKQVKSCVNCESEATIECEKCRKVYFCSTRCGISYWENGHYLNCEGLK